MKIDHLLSAGTFVLVVLLGSGLLAIAAVWFLKAKWGIRIPKLAQIPLLWLLAYILFRFILQPPIPFSLLAGYMAITIVGTLLYLSSTEASWREFIGPVQRFLEDERSMWEFPRWLVFSAIPVFAAAGTFYWMLPKFEEPIELRTIHAAPPRYINLGKGPVVLEEMRNPFQVNDRGEYSMTVQREEAKGNPWGAHPSRYLAYIREGGEIYFQNCVFCHGANLDAGGVFSYALRPYPLNLRSIARVVNPMEGDTFWRVYVGGEGQPRMSFPWALSMPAMEKFLSVDEIWKVILYEYWEAGYAPWWYRER